MNCKHMAGSIGVSSLTLFASGESRTHSNFAGRHWARIWVHSCRSEKLLKTAVFVLGWCLKALGLRKEHARLFISRKMGDVVWPSSDLQVPKEVLIQMEEEGRHKIKKPLLPSSGVGNVFSLRGTYSFLGNLSRAGCQWTKVNEAMEVNVKFWFIRVLTYASCLPSRQARGIIRVKGCLPARQNNLRLWSRAGKVCGLGESIKGQTEA